MKLNTVFKAVSMITATLIFSTFANATIKADLEGIKNKVQNQIGSKNKISSIQSTPLSGVYEITVGKQIAYTDVNGRYMIQGEIIDLETGENLTENRTTELNKIRFADLPLNQAIKVVRGNGQRVLAVFADPNCGYCKKLEKTLLTLDNVTVYTFLLPILSEDSQAKAQSIWCSMDRAKTWMDWMTKDIAPLAGRSCSHPLENNQSLAKNFGISGTPAIFFTDGTRIPGAAGAQALERKLASLKK
jgi:thiol:disulfide interchange protein DsbC